MHKNIYLLYNFCGVETNLLVIGIINFHNLLNCFWTTLTLTPWMCSECHRNFNHSFKNIFQINFSFLPIKTLIRTEKAVEYHVLTKKISIFVLNWNVYDDFQTKTSLYWWSCWNLIYLIRGRESVENVFRVIKIRVFTTDVWKELPLNLMTTTEWLQIHS